MGCTQLMRCYSITTRRIVSLETIHGESAGPSGPAMVCHLFMLPPLERATSGYEADGVTQLAVGIRLVSQIAPLRLVILSLNLGL